MKSPFKASELAKLKALKLTASEKALGRAAIFARLGETPSQRPGWWLWLTHHAPAALAILFLAGGTSWAAEQAVPGEILHTVKTNVNEPIRGLFARDSGAQAHWQAERVDRRLKEISVLRKRGRLKPELESNIMAHLENQEFSQLEAAFKTRFSNMDEQLAKRRARLNHEVENAAETALAQARNARRAGLKARETGGALEALMEYRAALRLSDEAIILINRPTAQ